MDFPIPAKIPWRKLAWLAIRAFLIIPASATIVPVNYFRMGEDDPAAVAGGSTYATNNHFSTSTLSRFGGDPIYTGDVAAEAAARVGSTSGLTFGGTSYLLGSRFTAGDNFGIEAWARPASNTANALIVYNGKSGTDGCGIEQAGNVFQGRIGATVFGSAPVTTGNWCHLALVRNGGVMTLYVNGVDCGTSSVAMTTATLYLNAGGSGETPVSERFVGILDELRTFTFASGGFTPDDLMRRAAEISIEQPVGTPVNTGGICDFGVVVPNDFSMRGFSISSTGLTSLTGLTASINGADANSFSIVSGPPSTIATGQTAVFTVQFVPVRPGRRTAVLNVASNDPDESPYRIIITGTTPGREIAVEQPAAAQLASGTVTTWGSGTSLRTIPTGLSDVTSLVIGLTHALTRRGDGTVVGWGSNTYGEASIPPDLPAVNAVAAGTYHSLAVTSAGTVVAWGRNNSGQTTVPVGLDGVTAVAAGFGHSLALKSDGTVVAWGSNTYGQVTIPSGLSNVTAIAAGDYHNLALKSDGTVVAWGRNTNGQTTIPAGLAGIVAVTAGGTHSLALRSTGTVAAWGSSFSGQTTIPSGLSGVKIIAAGPNSSMAQKSDGSLVTWGSFFNTIPASTVVGARALDMTDSVVGAVTDSEVSFGSQMVPYPTAPKTFTLRNIGSETLHVSSATLTGPNASDFAITAPAWPLDLPASGTVEVPVTFTPSALGKRWATLRIASDDPGKGDFAVSLTGTGIVAGPDIAVFAGNSTGGPELTDSAGSQNFPDTTVDGASPVKTFTIFNAGHTDLTGIKLSKTGANPGDLVIGLPGATTLAPGANTTFTVTFSPKAGGARSAVVNIASNDGNENPFEINLTGNALAAEIAVESPAGVPMDTGKVTVWGTDNSYGQHNVPAGVAGVRAVAMGDSFALALLNDGTVTGWGLNHLGQTSPPEGLGSVSSIATCYSTSFALKADGTVVAWGSNSHGEMPLPAGLSGVTKIAASGYHAMALKNDGSVITWGQLIFPDVAMPVGLTGVVDIATSGYCAAALKSNGSVVVWGDSGDHQTEVPAGLTGVTKLAAGDYFIAALKNDGTVVTWGGSYPNQSDYPAPYGLTGVVDIAASHDSIMARRADGSMVIWGEYGQTVAIPSGLSGVVVMAAGYSDYMAVSHALADFGSLPVTTVSGTRTFVIRNTGTLPLAIGPVELATGNASDFLLDTSGIVGTVAPGSQTTFSVRFAPGSIGSRSATLRVTSSDHDERIYDILLTGTGIPHVPIISLEETGGAILQNGTVLDIGHPISGGSVPQPAGLAGVRSVSAGSRYTMALKRDGTIAAWGTTSYGTVFPPYDLKDVASIAAGPYQSVALKTDGSIVSWGDTGDIGATIPAGLIGVTQLSAGADFAVALKSNGTVVAWGGRNDYYQLSVPAGLNGVAAVAAGDHHSLALKADGTVVSWGYAATAPPAGLTGIVAIAAGADHSLALKSNGTVVGWGLYSDASAFNVPAGLAGVVAIATSASDSLALRSDGTVTAWGVNYDGQADFPPGMAGVKAIAAGAGHSVILQQALSDFATRAVAAAGTRKNYIIRNSGSQPLHVTGVSVQGGDAGDFTVDTTGMLATLAAGNGTTGFSVSFSPGATGFRSTTLRVLSDDVSEPVFEVRLTGNGAIPATPREAWRLTYFGTAANAGNAADGSDPNHNGISNLLEYVLGGDPSGNSIGILPIFETGGNGQILFRFTRNPALTDVTLTVQASSNLDGAWIDLARSTNGQNFIGLQTNVTVEEVPSENGQGVTVMESIPDLSSAPAKRFLKLHATSP